MRWLAPVAVVVGVLFLLAILGMQGSFAIGALTIFVVGIICGRLVRRMHLWFGAGGVCVAATVGLVAAGLYARGDDPWWQLIALIVGALTVCASAAWCAGVWIGAKLRPHT